MGVYEINVTNVYSIMQANALYAYCGNNPIVIYDPLGIEIVVVSGGVTSLGYDESDGSRYEKFKYQFIETALNEIVEITINQTELKTKSFGTYEPEEVTWIVMNYGYSEDDIKSFTETAENWGVNTVVINEKDEFINYINTKSVNDNESTDMRTSDPITNFSVYSHGLVGTLGFGYDYNGSPTYDKGRALNFYLEDIDKLNDGAFSNTWSYFYSCNTGTENDNGISFAQAWSNKTGGVSKAVSNAKTDYSNINVVPLWNIVGLIEKSFAKKSREEYGYSQTGSVNYPKPQKGVKWSYFYPKN